MAVPAHRIEETWASSPFGAFAPAPQRRSRRWLVSLLVSLAIYAAAIAAIIRFGGSPVARTAQKIVDLTFVPQIPTPHPPPPPPSAGRTTPHPAAPPPRPGTPRHPRQCDG